jgi:hypothetical protein
MRILKIVALCAALGGCGALQQQAVAARPSEQFVGQKVDSLAARFGPPARSKRMDDGQASYLWNLTDAADSAGDHGVQTGPGGLYGDGRTPGYISFDPRSCKLSVVASPEGIITQFIAEDLSGTGAPATSFGISPRSICAERLGTRPQT